MLVLVNVYNRKTVDSDWILVDARHCVDVSNNQSLYNRIGGFGKTVLDLMLAGY